VFQDASGMTAMKRIHQMKKIEIQYMTPRSNEFEVIIPEDVVIVNIGAPTMSNGPRPMEAVNVETRMMLSGGRFRLRR
jgi:hypothetical protein